eukprot:476742-Prymnesium_polylepis.1
MAATTSAFGNQGAECRRARRGPERQRGLDLAEPRLERHHRPWGDRNRQGPEGQRASLKLKKL